MEIPREDEVIDTGEQSQEGVYLKLQEATETITRLKAEVAELKGALLAASKVLYPSKKWMADEWRERGLLED